MKGRTNKYLELERSEQVLHGVYEAELTKGIDGVK